MKPSYEELEQMLEESQLEFRSADITMQNLEAKCEKLAADNVKAMESLKQADAAVKLAHEKFSELADENMALKSAHCNGMVLPETPATDAFLTEVGASAIELAASERWGSGYVFDELNEFASQLRKGAAL